VGSDSGRIIVLEYDPKTSNFVKLHQETYGKSGARRIVPGQYLATDPKGRAVMIAAVEKAKLVYILNRDATANLTISSPLEAHKNSAIIHHIVGLDVGFENPVFAALEVDYTESDQDPTGEAFNNTEKASTISFHPLTAVKCSPFRCSHIMSWILGLITSFENGANRLTREPIS
jgi:splicing factor 3B subunit 3